jgi:hypothetical protein
MKTKTNTKAGSSFNHNQSMKAAANLKSSGSNRNSAMKVRSNVKAGSYPVTMDPLPWMGRR